jgi:hypothetical protein
VIGDGLTSTRAAHLVNTKPGLLRGVSAISPSGNMS